MRGVVRARKAANGASSLAGEDSIAAHAPVGHLLRRAYHKARQNSSRLFGVAGLTPRQAIAMMEIARLAPVSQAGLGAAIGMEPANVHALVARLKKKSLVRVARDRKDPRRLLLSLSASGKRAAAGLSRTARDSERATLQGLTDGESRILLRLLHKLLAVP